MSKNADALPHVLSTPSTRRVPEELSHANLTELRKVGADLARRRPEQARERAARRGIAAGAGRRHGGEAGAERTVAGRARGGRRLPPLWRQRRWRGHPARPHGPWTARDSGDPRHRQLHAATVDAQPGQGAGGSLDPAAGGTRSGTVLLRLLWGRSASVLRALQPARAPGGPGRARGSAPLVDCPRHGDPARDHPALAGRSGARPVPRLRLRGGAGRGQGAQGRRPGHPHAPGHGQGVAARRRLRVRDPRPDQPLRSRCSVLPGRSGSTTRWPSPSPPGWPGCSPRPTPGRPTSGCAAGCRRGPGSMASGRPIRAISSTDPPCKRSERSWPGRSGAWRTAAITGTS